MSEHATRPATLWISRRARPMKFWVAGRAHGYLRSFHDRARSWFSRTRTIRRNGRPAAVRGGGDRVAVPSMTWRSAPTLCAGAGDVSMPVSASSSATVGRVRRGPGSPPAVRAPAEGLEPVADSPQQHPAPPADRSSHTPAPPRSAPPDHTAGPWYLRPWSGRTQSQFGPTSTGLEKIVAVAWPRWRASPEASLYYTCCSTF